MLKTITPDEMKRLEENYMNRTGTSAFQLMESAARHVADAVAELAGEAGGTVLCLCGPGSNGGDGLAAMRLLTASHPELRAMCWLLPGTLNDAAEHQLRRLQAEAPAVEVVRLTDDPLPSLPENVCCFVDSLFGTGLSRPLTGTALALCALMNEHERIPTLAVDIPSGLDGTTGVILGCAVRADRTVTFHRPKPGLYRGYGLDFAGQVDVVSIGIPSDEGTSAGFDVLEPSDLRRLLPPRRHLSHKGTYGRVVLLAGSKGMAGAAGRSRAGHGGLSRQHLADHSDLMPLRHLSAPAGGRPNVGVSAAGKGPESGGLSGHGLRAGARPMGAGDGETCAGVSAPPAGQPSPAYRGGRGRAESAFSFGRGL